ncbi:ABC transporter substrate-binding protein [Blastococcus sp. TF02-8]|uniref:MCE family protein n=1 Tax=Blastococcus sp. TF02-8 TaxID=2250574 RepID=UPI000DEB25B0|nr:MCE family protein [Blastococcus sp. TF02-8]RBY97253.1 ABC transporter substrate-binding protein [Blastococcus sp. TF02-8]
MSKRGLVIRRRLQGVAFLATLVLLLGLAVAAYQKAFTDMAEVTLRTDSVGNQLQEASDVKVRGVIVGEVRAVDADVDGAEITLGIRPQYLEQIPADVTARLLPKTLFGERFVSLELPVSPSSERLADGDVIDQDRSENAIELQRVVDDLLPLLQAVEPQDLSYTLGAVADALRGRGDKLGENLAEVGDYTGQINTVLPQLQADISAIADVADTYDAAADDLLGLLDNLAITSTTLVDQQEQLRRTFSVGTTTGNVTAGFLETNERNLITLADSSRPVLGVFAKYSPEYPCLLNGLTRFNPMISEAFGADGDPSLNLNIVVSLPPRNPYVPGDQPAYLDKSGPDCQGLDDIDGMIRAAARGEYYCPAPPADGVDSVDNPVYGNPVCIGGRNPDDAPEGAGEPNPGASAGNSLPFNLAGSTAELDFVRNILAYQTGEDPGKVSDLAASTMAPLLRGTQVALR